MRVMNLENGEYTVGGRIGVALEEPRGNVTGQSCSWRMGRHTPVSSGAVLIMTT